VRVKIVSQQGTAAATSFLYDDGEGEEFGIPHTACGMLAGMQAGLQRAQLPERIQIFTTLQRMSSAVTKFRTPCILRRLFSTRLSSLGDVMYRAVRLRAWNTKHINSYMNLGHRLICLMVVTVFLRRILGLQVYLQLCQLHLFSHHACVVQRLFSTGSCFLRSTYNGHENGMSKKLLFN
jgi:hypothetical protein